MRSILTLATVLLCASFALPQATATSTKASAKQSAEAKPVEPLLSLFRIKPGDPCHTNNDGVQACNPAGGSGDITIDPKTGSASSATTVEFKNDATGSVTGLDGNDTVNTANGSNATISGTGGTVNAGSGSTGSVSNTGAAGGASITVNIGGGSFSVPPGATIPFSG